MTRVAAIDCGTNTIRLLIAEADRDDSGRPRLEVLRRRNEIVRLGQGVDRTGLLRERLDQALSEDAELAVGPNSLWLDTARYRLAPGVRAFGVVVTSAARGASCPDAGYEGLLTLVAPEGEHLRPVFTTYLSTWTTVKGVSCSDGFEMEQANLTIGIGPQRSHGYADLIVTAQVRSDYDKPVSRTVSQTLHYDGSRYPFDEYPTFWHSKPQP